MGLASAKQNKHTEVIVGEPGSGKSLIMNMLSNAIVCNAQQKLPFIAVVDKGYSAQGQIQLIRDSLPRNARMKPSAGHCEITAITAAICWTSSWVPVTPSPRN